MPSGGKPRGRNGKSGGCASENEIWRYVAQDLRSAWQPPAGIKAQRQIGLPLVPPLALGGPAAKDVCEGKGPGADRGSTGTVAAVASVQKITPMFERMNRMMLRNLAALKSWQQPPAPNVSVKSAGQVNVGKQQVNVTQNGDGRMLRD